MNTKTSLDTKDPACFIHRHIGSSQKDLDHICQFLEVSSLDELVQRAFPKDFKSTNSINLAAAITESELLNQVLKISQKNLVFKSYIGKGYKASHTPACIQRNILENPVWYTSYTPYQSELAQGRLEALLNFQTMVASLTGMDIANSSLLDEGTALAEALTLAKNITQSPAKKCFVDSHVFSHNVDVLKTRAEALGWEIHQEDYSRFQGGKDFFAAILQYPNSQGSIEDIQEFLTRMSSQNCFCIVTTDLHSLSLIKSPGELGAQAVVGTTQNFGIPLFFGGPHAAFFATKQDYIRSIPGRIVGVSKDRHGKQAYRLSLQTREQHIRREKATSNICTAQALLATMAGFYAVYHGPENLKKIAIKINDLAQKLYKILESFTDIKILNKTFFDTLSFQLSSKDKAQELYQFFQNHKINLAYDDHLILSICLDETSCEKDLDNLHSLLKQKLTHQKAISDKSIVAIPKQHLRTSSYLQHPVFNSYHSETELLRYIHKLQNKELALTHSMIPLGSCTMKLNAVSEMLAMSWPAFCNIHPFVPLKQSLAWQQIILELENQLCEITGFKAFSFQSNAGSQGEYAGLLAIKKYHESQGHKHKNICFIPSSAHGTNPASAVMAGLVPILVPCTKQGLIDSVALQNLLKKHENNVAAMMITYPSTYGFFEDGIQDLCKKLHKAGGLVYLDGANMNAMLGLCRPADLGFDVCHLNLHKTFCIPHGGGGPGVGPVGVSEKLKDFLPSHAYSQNTNKLGAISSAPYGNAGVLLISWSYIKLMGLDGLKKSAQVALANANYIAKKLQTHYPVLFKNTQGWVAHECIIDFRKFKITANIQIDDIAKRLIDYSFHAPTMSWPVPGTLMIEPTESENKKELDMFCESLISIKQEINLIIKNKNMLPLLKSAPHTLEDLMLKEWPFPYSKQQAFYPLPWVKDRKFWSPVSRIENAFGDIHPFCSCPAID